jgi:hypothetical protein
MTPAEFSKQLAILKSRPDFDSKRRYPAIMLYQYYLIGRSDDICEFRVDGMGGHDRFDFATSTCVQWAKNVYEERQYPDQIGFGSMDPDHCLFIHLGI